MPPSEPKHQRTGASKVHNRGRVFCEASYKLAVEAADEIGKVTVELAGACTIPNAADQIKKFKARSLIGKKRKSPKC